MQQSPVQQSPVQQALRACCIIAAIIITSAGAVYAAWPVHLESGSGVGDYTDIETTIDAIIVDSTSISDRVDNVEGTLGSGTSHWDSAYSWGDHGDAGYLNPTNDGSRTIVLGSNVTAGAALYSLIQGIDITVSDNGKTVENLDLRGWDLIVSADGTLTDMIMRGQNNSFTGNGFNICIVGDHLHSSSGENIMLFGNEISNSFSNVKAVNVSNTQRAVPAAGTHSIWTQSGAYLDTHRYYGIQTSTNDAPTSHTPQGVGQELQIYATTNKIYRAFGSTTNDWVQIYP